MQGLDGNRGASRDRTAADMRVENRVHLRFREGHAHAGADCAGDAQAVRFRAAFREGRHGNGAGNVEGAVAAIGPDRRGSFRLGVRAGAGIDATRDREGVRVRVTHHLGQNREIDRPGIRAVVNGTVQVGLDPAVGLRLGQAGANRHAAAGDPLGIGLGLVVGTGVDRDIASDGKQHSGRDKSLNLRRGRGIRVRTRTSDQGAGR